MGNQKSETRLNWMRFVILTLVVCAAVPVPSVAVAADGGKTLGETITLILGNQMEYIPRLISALCYIGGLMLMASGVLKLKGHAENPSQVKIEHGIARMFAGGCLITLPAFTGWVVNSIQIAGDMPAYIHVAPKFGS